MTAVEAALADEIARLRAELHRHRRCVAKALWWRVPGKSKSRARALAAALEHMGLVDEGGESTDAGGELLREFPEDR